MIKTIHKYWLTLAVALTPTVVAASDIYDNLNTAVNGTGIARQTNINDFLTPLVTYFLSLLGIIAVILIMYGGWQWMTAGGDEAKVKKAKELMKNAVIGLIIIVCAYLIVSIVVDVVDKNLINKPDK